MCTREIEREVKLKTIQGTVDNSGQHLFSSLDLGSSQLSDLYLKIKDHGFLTKCFRISPFYMLGRNPQTIVI